MRVRLALGPYCERALGAVRGRGERGTSDDGPGPCAGARVCAGDWAGHFLRVPCAGGGGETSLLT